MLDPVAAAIGEGLVALDRDLRYVYMNDAAERLLGVPRAAFLDLRLPAILEALLA